MYYTGPLIIFLLAFFYLIDEKMIFDAATKTKGSAGPSGMDAELYRRIHCSKNLKLEGKALREEITVFTRNLLKIAHQTSLLEGYTSCRLIPLDKISGIRSIGVGEILRRIVGKTIAGFLKKEIKEAAGPLQVCADHSAGSEAAIHAMSQVFVEEGTDGILLKDESNAFSRMNRSVALHNIQITCNAMSLYIINTYRSQSRLFICGGGEILSQEGTTQEDPLAMPWYYVNTSITIQSLRISTPGVKQVWLTDDSAGGGQIVPLYNFYNHLSKEGKKYGYLANGSKSWLVDKSDVLVDEAKRVFFTNGYKSKFTYFMYTIKSFEDYVDPIQEVIDYLLLPTLSGQTEPLPSDLRQLVTLTPAQGGLGAPDLRFEATQQFSASTSIAASHLDSITTHSMFMVAGENSTKEFKRQHQALKTASAKSRMESIDSTLPLDLLRSVNQSRYKGASSWLTAVPLVDQRLEQNKQEFRDSLRLWYNMPCLTYQVSVFVVRSIPSAMPCHAKRECS